MGRRLKSRSVWTSCPVCLVVLAAVWVLAGCGAGARPGSSDGIPRSLLLESRPVGRGERFHPPAVGPVTGSCRPRLGRRVGAHLEVFAANRVVLVAAGIGARPPRTLFSGRIAHAGCYGDVVTLDPTGLLLIRAGARLTVATVFRAWGQPLSAGRIASFAADQGQRVAVFVDGRRRAERPGDVPLSRHAEIVLEVGPYVPPHASYTFPPGS